MSHKTAKVGREGDRESPPVGGGTAGGGDREAKEKDGVKRQLSAGAVSRRSSFEGPRGPPRGVAERESAGQGDLKFNERRGGRVRREGRRPRALTSSRKSRGLTTIVEQKVKGEGGKHEGKGRDTGATGKVETSEADAGGEVADGRGPERHYRVFGGTGKTPMSTGSKIRENVRTFMDTYHVGVQRIGVSQGYSFDEEEKQKELDLAPYNPDWGEGSSIEEKDGGGTLVYTAFSQLALYCPIKIGRTETYALVDCGAGINLANSRFIASLISEFGKRGIEVVRDRLVVRVADGKNWILNRKANIRYEVSGQEFVQEYWLSPDLKEDVLLGMPSLRAQEVSLHIGLKAGTDVLHLRRSGLDVALKHFPNGVQIGDLPLKSVETAIIPRGRGRWLRVGLGDPRGLLWPKGRDLTGVVGSTPAQGYSCHAMESVNSIQQNSTSIFVKNHTDRDCKIFVGEEVARLQPMLFETEKDEQGRDYLYEGARGSLHPKLVGQSQYASSGNSGRSVHTISPCAVRDRTVQGDVVQERVHLLGPEERRIYARRHRVSMAHVEWDAPTVRVDSVKGNEASGGKEEMELQEAMDAKVGIPARQEGYTWRDVTINGNLSEEERGEVQEVIQRHPEFFESGQQHFPNPRLPDWTKLTIKLKSTATPWCTRSYPLSEYKRQIMRDIVGKQLRQGMISHSSSCYASPSFLVAKGGGGSGPKSYRLIIDLRLLNAQVEKSSWPIPRISEILDKLHGCSWFSSIDLADGFHQIGVSEESRKYTAFVTEDGLYEYQTVPMGLSISPNHFQYVMDRILGGMGGAALGGPASEESKDEFGEQENLIGKDCMIYIDDCLVFSRDTLGDHLERLERVIRRLSSFGLRGKSPKILLAMKELKFLGHIIGVGGRRPCPKKVEAIDRIPIPSGPKAKDMILAFLGMTGFYRSYSDDFEGLAAPLRELTLTKADPDRDWTDVHTNSFKALKDSLKTAPVLAYPDFQEAYIIKTDASKTHVAGILGQNQGGQFRVIEYLSKRLNTGQREWHMTHLEGWAVVYSLQKWSRYVEGRTGTTVVTDHEALIWIRHNRFSDCSGKLIRWITYIDSFGIEFEHRRGKDHGDVDGLTRVYDGEEDITWEPEEQALLWMFELLVNYIPGKYGTVHEVNVRGPTGRSVFEGRFQYGRLSLAQLQDGREVAGSPEDLVVAAPPGRRAILQALFEGLQTRRCAWAVWAPLEILQASYFKATDVQLLVVREGGRGMYGANSKGRPAKFAWITHGLVDRNVMLKTSVRKGKIRCIEEKSPPEVVVHTVAEDWCRWREDDVFHEDPEGSDEEEVWASDDVWSMSHFGVNRVDADDYHMTVESLVSSTEDSDRRHAFAETEPWCRAAGGHQLVQGGRYDQPMRGQADLIRKAVCEARKQRIVDGPHRAAAEGPTEEVVPRAYGIASEEDRESKGGKRRFVVPEVVRKEIERVRQQREALADLSLQSRPGAGRGEAELVSEKLQEELKTLSNQGLREGGHIEPMSATVIRSFQSKDSATKDILDLLESVGEAAEQGREKFPPRVLYSNQGGILMVADRRERFNTRTRYFVPIALRPHLLHLYHRSKLFCHPGRDRMYETMSQDYFWPNMSRDIGDFVAGCLACQRAKVSQPLREGKTMTVVPEKPFGVIGMDVYGPFPFTSSERKEDQGYRYIISMVDYYSRWMKLIPVKEDPTAETVARVLVYQWIRDFSVPELLATDKDSVFRAQLTQEVGRLLGIRMHVFPAESQWRAGRVERVHRYLGNRLRIWRRDKVRTWHLFVPFIEMSHHFMVMPQYGMSPYEILYGQRPRLPFTQGEWSSGGYVGAAYGFVRAVHVRLRRIQERFNEIESRLVQDRLARMNKARKSSPLCPGDRALVYTKGTKDKLTCLWSDQVRIESRVGDSTFEVRYPNGERERVPAQRLRKFMATPHRAEDAVGPFVTDFPHFAEEGGAVGRPDPMQEELLPEAKVPARGQGQASGLADGRESPTAERKFTLRYGDYAAYLDPLGNWGVGQFLDEGEYREGGVRLRRLGTLHYGSRSRTPREYVWRYHWTAQRGRDVLAKQGRMPTARPSAKNTGRLSPTVVDLKYEDILGPVHLNKDGTIENDSWTALMNSIQDNRPTLTRLFVKSIQFGELGPGSSRAMVDHS